MYVLTMSPAYIFYFAKQYHAHLCAYAYGYVDCSLEGFKFTRES